MTIKHRKHKADRKERVLRIRLTSEQQNRLAGAASHRGLPLSTWLLMIGLDAAEALKKSEGAAS